MSARQPTLVASPVKSMEGRATTHWIVTKVGTPMIMPVMSQMMGLLKLLGIKRRKNKYKSNQFYFSEKMQFHFFLLLLFLSNDINTLPLNLGRIPTPLNDPHSDQSGGLSSNQFTSNLFCSCSCFRKAVTRNHTVN